VREPSYGRWIRGDEPSIEIAVTAEVEIAGTFALGGNYN
jgi:hypothetical protein